MQQLERQKINASTTHRKRDGCDLNLKSRPVNCPELASEATMLWSVLVVSGSTASALESIIAADIKMTL